MTQALTILIALSALALMGSMAILVALLIMKAIKSFMKKDTIKLKKPIVISAIIAPCSLFVIIVSMIVGQSTDPTAWCAHEYTVLEQKDANCTNSGYIKKMCSLCNNEITETIEPYHIWVEDSVIEATCTSQKQIKKKCARCETTEYEKVGDLLNHSWIEDSVIAATCSHPKQLVNKCSMCGTTNTIEEGSTIPHSFGEWIVSIEPTTEKEGQQTRKCTVCDHSENTTILKKSPITIFDQSYSIDFLGGVEITRKIKNNTDKVIKYITLEWKCYNAVDDLIYDTITGESTQRKYWTGPFNPGQTTNLKATGFYNSTFSNAVLTEIQIEFMDGQIINITSEEYTEIFK